MCCIDLQKKTRMDEESLLTTLAEYKEQVTVERTKTANYSRDKTEAPLPLGKGSVSVRFGEIVSDNYYQKQSRNSRQNLQHCTIWQS